MKKVLVIMAALLTMLVSSAAMAADVSSKLDKENDVVETMVKSFSDSTVTYNAVEKNLAAELQEKFTAREFEVLGNTVNERFGRTKEVKFVSYEKFDSVDRVTYLGSFSRENTVLMTFIFDNQSYRPKLTGMTMVPLEVKADGTVAEKRIQ